MDLAAEAILYVDTSAFIPLVLEEPGSALARAAWAASVPVCSSRLLVVETAAALSRAQRMARIDATEHDSLRTEFAALLAMLSFIEVSAAIIDRAAEHAARYGLRGYDAVHLASAEAAGGNDIAFATGDSELLAAVGACGWQAIDTSGRR